MSIQPISPESLDQALSIRDLTDVQQGPHAMQRLLDELHGALKRKWGCDRILYRSNPVVSVADNYDSLGYPPDGAARDARYTRYVSRSALLRTQTSAAIPTLLRSVSLDPPKDLMLVCPGLVYRRDVIDRLHVGEPHQVDIWRLKESALGRAELLEMIETVVAHLLPGRRHRVVESRHPYTIEGLQIDVEDQGDWVEIGECGLASPDLLQRCGLDVGSMSGLAMGLGLDRILMLRKGIPDIRLLRSEDPRVAAQMLDLEAYRAVSSQPAIRRDLSIAVDAELSPEELGDQVRTALGKSLDALESLEIVSDTPYEALPRAARERMGMLPHQKNLLVRLVIRHPTHTLSSEEANRIRDQVYLMIHQGRKAELTGA